MNIKNVWLHAGWYFAIYTFANPSTLRRDQIINETINISHKKRGKLISLATECTIYKAKNIRPVNDIILKR